jgi:hypothetical protein
MNKKVLTLCAGFLLAGGMFNAAQAVVDLAAAAADGGYYYVRVQGEKAVFDDAAKANVLMLQNGKLSHVEAVESDLTLWQVVANTINGEKVYSLVNKATNTSLSFDTPTAEKAGAYNSKATVTYFTAEQATTTEDRDQLKVYGVNDGYLVYNTGNNSFFVDTWSGSSFAHSGNTNLALSLEKVGSNVVEASELNKNLGSNAGFRIQIGNVVNNSFVAYTNLSEGNPFEGTLFASAGNIEGIITDGIQSYFLQKGDSKGDYIVLLNKKWDNFNTDHNGTEQKGYKFAVLSKEKLVEYLKKDAYNKRQSTPNYTPIIKAIKFTVEESVNSSYLEVSAIDADNTSYELLVSSFGNQTVLTTDADTEAFPSYANSDNKTYVRFGAGNIVKPTDFVKKDSYYTITRKVDGYVLSVTGCEKQAEFLNASEVLTDMPEGMWALYYDATNNTYSFTNREASVEAAGKFVQQANQLYVVDAANNLYEWGGVQYIITTTAIKDLKPAYADLDVINTKYVAGVYSPIHKNSAWFVENHVKSHKIGLDADEDNATVWSLIKNNRESEVDPITDLRNSTDSVYVFHTLSYYDNANKVWKTTKDTLKAVSYKFVNEYKEALTYGSESQYIADKTNAANFVLKKVGDYYNMIEVELPNENTTNGHASFIFNKKVYGGDSAEKGLLAQTCAYERIENDIIEVKPVTAAMYRRIVNDLDTISIFRQENNKQMLFEDGKFLGLKNATQFEFAPAMVADTAYVRYNTYRPQYMLVVDPNITPAGKWCDECQSSTCAHAVETKGWIEGRYLVNLKDTAIAYDEEHKHPQTNPYINTEKYYRLGFVQAKHYNDSLIIASTNDSLFVGGTDYNQAKFAFRYVDQEAGSFVIETADFIKLGNANAGAQKETYGYIKWMNGVVVVVDNMGDADIFNMNEDEEGQPTANESINTSNVVVAGVNGAVVVKGAEGKNVIVSTILGKVVANEVVSSDNAQIAAPAGIVVVSVDGESFKVVVK